ncbi:MAG: periplasmic heavy metal sensor [Acidobacteria bacterium]|nr:periplasmic heavy metal sensor [Acidobacteriota bacterium]
MKSPVLAAAAAFGALCFLPGAMFAPDGAASTDPRKPLSLREYLNLSETQVKQLETLRDQRKEQARASIDNLEQKQKALRTRLASSETEPLSVGSAVLQLELAKTRAEVTTSDLTEDAVAYLTPAQRAKLRDLERFRQLQPVLREAAANFLIAPPEAVVSGSGPLGMFTAPRKRDRRSSYLAGQDRTLAVSFPHAAQHAENNQVVKLPVE